MAEKAIAWGGSEVDEVVEGSSVGPVGGPKNGPVMPVRVGGDFFEAPTEVGDEERRGTGHGGKLVVVEEHDAPAPNEAAEVDQVDENPIEAVVAVDERKVECPALLDESGQRDLRILGVVLHEVRHPRLAEELQTAIGEPPALVGIDHDVVSCRVAVRDQPFADEQGGEPVAAEEYAEVHTLPDWLKTSVAGQRPAYPRR